MESPEGKNACTLDDRLVPHGGEIDEDEASVLCVDGKWVNKEDLVSVGC